MCKLTVQQRHQSDPGEFPPLLNGSSNLLEQQRKCSQFEIQNYTMSRNPYQSLYTVEEKQFLFISDNIHLYQIMCLHWIMVLAVG